jgi:hypothetical protein
MFTWICPQCGREVPPSYTECPDCAKRAAEAPPQQPAAPAPQPPPQAAPPQYPPPQAQTYYPPPPQQPQYAPPQQYGQAPQYAPPPQYTPPQQQSQYAPPQYQPPPSRGMNLPVWLLTILFAFGIGGVVGGIYWFLQTGKAQTGTGPAPTAAVESPAAKPGAKPNPLQKYIEVSGVRFVQDAKKKTQVRFVLINHSEADINGLAGNVTIWGRTRKSEEDAEGTFSFTTNLGPFESKEMTVPLTSKLKIYELPDWQNVAADVQITAPAGGA